MKRIFTFFFSFLCVLALNAQKNGIMVANFDDVLPYDVGAWGGLSVDYAPAPAGSLASGQMLVVFVPAGNGSGGSFTITLGDMTFDPHDFVGVSFDCQVPDATEAVKFVVKLQQTADPGHANEIADWNTWPAFNGGSEWQEMRVPFDVVSSVLDGKPTIPADQYDQIELLPAGWSGNPNIHVNMDNFMLRYDWNDDSGIPLTKAAALILKTENGAISVIGNNNPVSLKVYSLTGQEIAGGVNEAKVEAKGVYIVKATTGNGNIVQKIVVK